MTTTTMADNAAVCERYADVFRHSRRQSVLPIALIIAAIAYIAYATYLFEVPKLIDNLRVDRGVILATDSFAHKYHIVKRFKTGKVEVSLEGTRGQEFEGSYPEWVQVNDQGFDVDMGEGVTATVKGNVVQFSVPDNPVLTVEATEEGVLLRGDLPAWAKYSPRKFEARPSLFKRIQVTKTKVEVHRYFAGWENFFFDFNHPLNGKSFHEVVSTAFSSERVIPDLSNWQSIWRGIWYNKEWQHKDVFRALLETVIMALLGTVVASVIALPLAFLASENFNRNFASRMLIRRCFDFLRGIDTLIWSLIFIRAFGLGPLTGIMAIIFTMVGELGKLYSEAIENIDEHQLEGVKSTGASSAQNYAFGVLPQIMPVFISQTLYYLESNTRSATVIGALGAGGIGLMLVQTIQTSKDWENTLYLIILTLIVVIMMDVVSGRLRRRLL